MSPRRRKIDCDEEKDVFKPFCELPTEKWNLKGNVDGKKKN